MSQAAQGRAAPSRSAAQGRSATQGCICLKTASASESGARPHMQALPIISNIGHWRVDFLLPAHHYDNLGASCVSGYIAFQGKRKQMDKRRLTNPCGHTTHRAACCRKILKIQIPRCSTNDMILSHRLSANLVIAWWVALKVLRRKKTKIPAWRIRSSRSMPTISPGSPMQATSLASCCNAMFAFFGVGVQKWRVLLRRCFGATPARSAQGRSAQGRSCARTPLTSKQYLAHLLAGV